MALKTKLDFIGVDKTGRVITVKDSTGNYSSPDNEGGYGNPNPEITNITNILFTISEIESAKLNKLRFVRIADPAHPEYLVSPSIDDIASGVADVEFTSIVLGLTEPQEGLKAFNDGIYDINMYTLFEQIAGTASQGDKIITGNGFTSVYNSVDFIEVNNNIYTIDKTIPVNDNILTLVEELEEDINEFFPAYRANIKALNQAASDCCGTQEAGKLAENDTCGCSEKKFDKLFKLWMYKIAAQIDYNCGNYIQANDLLKGAQRVCKSLNCKC